MLVNKATWLDEFSLPETLHIASTLASREAEQAGVYRSELLQLIADQNWQGLLDFSFSYSSSDKVMDLFHARQAIGFFEKLTPLGELLGIDREKEAWEKFLKTERSCQLTNDMLRLFVRGDFCFLPELSRVLYSAKWKIEKVLGACPEFLELDPLLGPGASTTVKRRKACPAEKLGSTLACGPGFVPWIPFAYVAMPHVFEFHSEKSEEDEFEVSRFDVEIQDGRLSFVDKDAKSFRSIVVEPMLSSMYQLALGNKISDRLRFQGIDIRDQSQNQKLAWLGSVLGDLATLDLSSASDTISSELVRFLLPPEWFSLLSSFRSPVVRYKDHEIRLEKFSSMGNGYTFPLETLIFYALTWAASPHQDRSNISAYGDDLICAVSSASAVINALEGAGFEINRKKSYTAGPFRESCGVDYFIGINIRPYRLKKLVSNSVLFSIYNFYSRNFDDEACLAVLQFISPHLLLWGPDGFGDGHLIRRNCTSFGGKKPREGYAGYMFDTYSIKSRKSFRVLPGDHLQLLYSVYARGDQVSEVSEAGPIGQVVKTYPTDEDRQAYKRISIYTLSR